MSYPLHIEPTEEVLASLRDRADDGPVVALNLNRYRERAAYPEGTPKADVSGRQAYGRYGFIAFQAILSVGGQILWAAEAADLVIGCGHDRYDEVVAVWYPSRKAFLALEEFPGYMQALELHRRAGLEHATVLFFRAGTEPKLDTPYSG